MPSTIITKQGDTRLTVTDTPTLNGVPMLPSQVVGATVWFLMRTFDGMTLIRTQGTIGTDGSGNVQFSYKFQAADVAADGKYQMGWNLVFSGGDSLTFPNQAWNIVNIEPKLGF